MDTIRAGLRYTIDVPREKILELSRESREPAKDSCSLTLLATPTHWITLSEPVLAHGPDGIRRQVRAIGFQPDVPDQLERMLAPRDTRQRI